MGSCEDLFWIQKYPKIIKFKEEIRVFSKLKFPQVFSILIQIFEWILILSIIFIKIRKLLIIWIFRKNFSCSISALKECSAPFSLAFCTNERCFTMLFAFILVHNHCFQGQFPNFPLFFVKWKAFLSPLIFPFLFIETLP